MCVAPLPSVILSVILSAAQTVVVLSDGSEMAVDSFEIQERLVIIATLDGRLQSLPLSLVNVEATRALRTVEVVTLSFGWRAGWSARVETTTPGAATTHRLEVRTHAEGLLIAAERPGTSYLVRDNGAFLRALEADVDDDAAEYWKQLAGFWLDAELELGATYQTDITMPAPHAGSETIAAILEFGAVRRVSCLPDSSTADCVELVLRSYPNPELSPEFRDAPSRETVSTLIARPDGLIPHSLTTPERTIRFFWNQ